MRESPTAKAVGFLLWKENIFDKNENEVQGI